MVGPYVPNLEEENNFRDNFRSDGQTENKTPLVEASAANIRQ